ncbi:MAG: hypothetical protein JO307_28565 [Bryobacterales bacterium]|nr:hypothetical protein [Bryobacterales bacterium]
MDALTLIPTAVVAGRYRFLGSDLRKRGEDLATHEHIGKLGDQVAAVIDQAQQSGFVGKQDRLSSA